MYVDAVRHTSAETSLVSGGAAYQGSPGVKCLADQRPVTSGTAPRRSTCPHQLLLDNVHCHHQQVDYGIDVSRFDPCACLYVLGGRSTGAVLFKYLLQNCKLDIVDMYLKQGTHRPSSPQLGGMHPMR